jgi:hypothetical protein
MARDLSRRGAPAVFILCNPFANIRARLSDCAARMLMTARTHAGDPAMFKRIALAGMLLIVAVGPTPASGDNRMRDIMRTKLSNAQALLQAIVTVNYKEIDRSAATLNRISEMEIVSWQNPPKREYTEQAMLFITSVDDLRAASQKHDIEGVGAAYSTLITTCVHCHAYVRDARVASLLPLGAHHE